MTPERWQRVTDVFERVLAAPLAERATVLDASCAGDPELHAEVESLLATYEGSSDDAVFEGGPRPPTIHEAMDAFAPLAGKTVGPYEVERLLGRGGMSDVYRARDPRLARDVALKVLPSTFARDPERLRRFEQEARAAGMLSHPNVLAVYDVGQHDGAPYLVSELLEGETLRERLEAGPLPIDEALDVAVQVARGLTAAHEKGIVHRDLKPTNLFVVAGHRVKILDFGVAKLLAFDELGGASSLHTASGVLVGTAAYMSPEQAQGQRVDLRSDLFSFGAILYEMLTGRKAFERPMLSATLDAIIDEPAPTLADAGVAAPGELEAALARCLAKSPDDRFQSAGELATALEALAPAPSTKVTPIEPVGRRRTVALAMLGVLVLVAAVAAAFGGWWLYMKGVRTGQAAVTYQPLTVESGAQAARFAPDGKAVVFSAMGPDGILHIRSVELRTGIASDADTANSDLLVGWDDLTLSRTSPSGSRVAFRSSDTSGQTIDFLENGQARDDPWRDRHVLAVSGLAWTPRGDEVWYTVGTPERTDTIYGITLDKERRVVAHLPLDVALEDIFRDGRVLLRRRDTGGLLIVSGLR